MGVPLTIGVEQLGKAYSLQSALAAERTRCHDYYRIWFNVSIIIMLAAERTRCRAHSLQSGLAAKHN
jgi:hypothetical protein